MGQKEQKRDIEFKKELARLKYENEKVKITEIADELGINRKTVSRWAKDGGWKKYDPVSNKKTAPVKLEEVSEVLGAVSLRKISELAEELKGHYSTVDEPLAVAYSLAYEEFLELTLHTKRHGITEVSPKTGAEYLSPYFTAKQSVLNNLIKLGDKLGLSIASRKRLGMKLGESEDKAQSLFDLVEEIMTEDASS